MTTGRYTKFADGNTYGVSHVTGPNNQNELEDVTTAAPDHMATRVVNVAAEFASRRCESELS